MQPPLMLSFDFLLAVFIAACSQQKAPNDVMSDKTK